MIRAATLVLLAPFIGFSATLVAPGQARDFGAMGTTWRIVEPDLLQTIGGRLHAMEADGRMARMQQSLVDRTRAQVERPPPVAGIGHAAEARRWRFDPSVIVENDVRDRAGRLVAARGTRVNPLSFVQMKVALVFLNGDDAHQVAWALRTFTPSSAKLILVSGSPFALMRAHRRRIFFDQKGQLTGRLGIGHTPAVVRADGAELAIEEIVLAPGSRT